MLDPYQRLAKALASSYRLEGELGSGGMATVYLAEDVKHHRKVAVKCCARSLPRPWAPNALADPD